LSLAGKLTGVSWPVKAPAGETPPIGETSPGNVRPGVVARARGLYDRFSHLLHELGKFGVVGAVCYVIDVVIFNLVRDGTGEPITAKVISTVIATTFAFLGNRFWTWRHHERSGLHREYVLYFGFNLVGLGISLACLWLSHYGLGAVWPGVFTTTLADNISANVIGVGLASTFRFWAYRRYIFRPVPVTDRV
jgi:putative flippase GtrA